MKHWLFWLRWNLGLVFWEIMTPAGGLICRSVFGFVSEDEARKDLAKFHPLDHF